MIGAGVGVVGTVCVGAGACATIGTLAQELMEF